MHKTMIRAAFCVASFTTSGGAFDVELPALEADDECSALGESGDGCALQALQRRSSRGLSEGMGEGMEEYITKINGLLTAHLGDINKKISGTLKAKDPVKLHLPAKKSVEMTDLFGLSALHIDTFAAKTMSSSGITFNLEANWGKALKMVGKAKGNPVNVFFDYTSIKTDHIVANFDLAKKEISSFNVSQVSVHIKGFNIDVKVRRWFLARILNKKVAEKLMKQKAQIEGKMAVKVTAALGKVFNEKLKGALNAKLKKMIAAKSGGTTTAAKGLDEDLGSAASDHPESEWIPKMNGMFASKLSNINEKLTRSLKSKDSIELHIPPADANDKASLKSLAGMSSLKIDSLKVDLIKPPVITLAMKATWGSNLKMLGDADVFGKKIPFDVALQGTSFDTKEIVAHLSSETGAITKFEVGAVHVSYTKAAANMKLGSPFFEKIVNSGINKKIESNKGKTEGKLAEKMQAALNKVFNGKLKDLINGRMTQLMAAKV